MGKIDKLKTLIPLYEIEQAAQQQIYSALDLDFLIKLVIMPDVHCGYSLPIGGIALLEKVISPAYIGYDINCRMCCVNTNIPIGEIIKDMRHAEQVRNDILDRVPCGVGRGKTFAGFSDFKSATGDKELNNLVNGKLNQHGTLGSGNHFIEIGKNNKDNLSIVIHTGSRKPGWLIAQYYMNLSKKVDKDLPSDFLHLHGEYGQQYIEDMTYASKFADSSSREIMSSILYTLRLRPNNITHELSNMINETHNHAEIIGDNVLHRKGATPAELGQFGVIPGSMKAGTYITVGRGNDDYLKSSSHGAGRKLSRKKASESINIDIVRDQMKGIVCEVDEHMLDESPDAYKDLHGVIKAQEGIVIDVVDFIKPLINIKG